MKTSTTLVAMTITMLMLALPAGAADYTLGIFGNANEDEDINMVDVTYTELIIMERVDETQLADGKYDGEIDILDVTQIELIILGREKEMTLLDATDRIVTVEKPVERIVTHLPVTPEAIKIVGAGDRVVGRQALMDEVLFPMMSELPVTSGMCWDIYYEEVFEVDPDIFITAYHPMPGFEDVVATLEPEITVVVLNFGDPATLVENIRKLRYVLNMKEEGDAFIAFYEGVINDITEKTAGLTDEEKPKVFLKIGGLTPEALSTFTNTMTGIKDQMEIAGGINIAADLPGPGGAVMEVDTEWLIEQNPDIVTAMIWEVYYPDALGYEVDDDSVAEAAREEIMAMDIFAGGKAVEEGKVYLYEDALPLTPRFVVFIAYMAKWLHPELFEDLDPQAIHQEYLTDFLGLDYDLNEQGVFVYPEP